MPLIMVLLLAACAASAIISPALLAVATVSYWPLALYLPYVLCYWFFKKAPAIYS